MRHRPRQTISNDEKKRRKLDRKELKRDADGISIGFLTRYTFRAFVKVLAGELSPYNIVPGEWSVFRILWKGDGISQVELAQRMRVEKASLTSVLSKMQRKGLIRRTPDKADGRKINIALSQKGSELGDLLLPLADKINSRAIRGMRSGEVDQLCSLLARVIENLEHEHN
jgi:MarR family transcriptional regulator, organic hydroperoxide resistance regulator